MEKKKKRAAPEVLRRAYGSCVRTLADTIISLLPLPLAEECRCKGRCCLICSGRPFLVRDGDTSDYRRILTQGFAVLSDDTPLIAAFSPDQRWPQHSIVQNTIEMIMVKSSEPPNVICNGYDKQHRFSPIADVLTTSAWCLLLTRIGDCLMAHLLKHASIFLPLPRKNHLQVTGPPINESPRRQRSKVPEHKTFGFQSGVKSFQPSSVANHAEYGQRKKRRAEMEIDDKFMCDATVSMQQPSTSLCTDKLTGSVITDVGGKPKKRVRRFRWQRCRKRRMMDFRGVNVLNGYFTSNNVKDNSSGKLEQSSNADSSYSGKCKWSCDVVTQKHALEGQQLCTTESNAFQNDEAIVGESLHRSHPREMYLEEVIFQSSGIVIDSDLIHVSPEILEVKQGAFKKSLSSGIAIDSNWISTEINLRQDPFNQLLYLEGTSANLSKGSSCNVTHSGSRIDFPQKVLPSREFEKQCPCLVPSKKCFYCLMLQAPRNVERGAQVKRQCMFYTSSLSRSIFPRNHILNKLKPNDFGATTLMRCIFGLPDEHKGADSVPCCHDNNTCPIKSECLYHSLIDSLKNLIRKARHCQYLKLLGRHCSIPTLHSCTNVEDGSTSREREMHMKLSLFRVLTRKKTNAGLKSASKLCLRKSYGHVNIQQEGSPLETSRLYHNQLKLSRSYCKHKQVQCKQVRRRTLHHLLREHVKHNLLQLGQNLYLQEVGIPQGSVLSSLLCSFYYGHLERNVIFPSLENSHEPLTVGCGNCGEQDVNRCLHIHEDHVTRKSDDCFENQSSAGPTHMLLRLIDDFLFISTSKKQATSFLSMLQRGFGDYNCWMNDGKFRMNFDPEYQSEILPNTMYTGEDGVSLLPWSGLLVNCRTLEIQADYTRYWTTHMSSTLTVNGQSNPSSCLKAKLCDYMRPKCHPIFYDSNINSPAIVRLNAYQAFLLCAMKFHCYIFTTSKTGLSPNFYLEIIQRSFRYGVHDYRWQQIAAVISSLLETNVFWRNI